MSWAPAAAEAETAPRSRAVGRSPDDCFEDSENLYELIADAPGDEVHAQEGRQARGPSTYEPLQVYAPGTWLLREGWKKLSATIARLEVPSAKR